MPIYEVIVGNVGSVYRGRSRVKALAIYESYVTISREHDMARCYGEDVTLMADGELESEHRGHLSKE
jgi:hypothetical protein